MNEEQQDELFALKEIYGDLLIKNHLNPLQTCIEVLIPLPNPHLLQMPTGNTIVINHLPSIRVFWEYSAGYPETDFINLSLDCIWISTTDRLSIIQVCKSWWVDQKSVIIFQLIDFLANDLINHLDWSSVNVDGQIQFNLPKHYSNTIYDAILVYNDERNQSIFNLQQHLCGVCRELKLGSQSIQFNHCKHIFCRICVSDYFTFLINQGSVELVCCPDEQCKKLAKDNPIESGLHHLTQSDLEKILSNDMLDRYYELYHEHSLQARADIIHCPRPSCQYPNLKPSNKDEKLIICITCGFVFCHLCCNVWHGYGANCKIKNSDFILQTYLEGDESIQTDLKLRYGHSIIEKLVKEYQDLQSTLDWVKNNTQQCPQCLTAVQRSYGCNHMTCGTCQSHFCYQCGDAISATNPYIHYNARSSPCYGKLFEGSDLNDLGDVFDD